MAKDPAKKALDDWREEIDSVPFPPPPQPK
jgi:hypothetical protein